MKRFFAKLKSLIPTKRRIIQLYAALLFNANIKGIIHGVIYQGPVKNICTPGLNCYSCPGASGACPLGALQNAMTTSEKRTPYYIFGILMLWGLMLGRFICGFLCPFGLIQDLLHKIKTPKIKKNKLTRALSYFKYVILVFFVVIIPLAYMFRDLQLPAFCKYICPAGTLGGAIALLINPKNEDMLGMLGPLFTWKFLVLVLVIVGSVFIYRFFCRFFCPLGALYGLFNKFALFGIKLEKPKCINCGKCISKCQMDIKEVGDHECINCGECISVCPTEAIQWRGGKIILPDNEIPADATEEEKTVIEGKRKKRTLTVKIVAAVLMVALLGGALYYYNFVDEIPESNIIPGEDEDDGIRTGNRVGNRCLATDLAYVEGYGEGVLNISSLRGKVVVLNFWGTWCAPCKQELPYFNQVASEYSTDEVVVITIHTSWNGDETPTSYIGTNYPDSNMLFVTDSKIQGSEADAYYTALGGKGSYPMTLVLDGRGVICEKVVGSMEYAELKAAVDNALGN